MTNSKVSYFIDENLRKIETYQIAKHRFIGMKLLCALGEIELAQIFIKTLLVFGLQLLCTFIILLTLSLPESVMETLRWFWHLGLWMKSYSVTVQMNMMKPLQQDFHLTLFLFQYFTNEIWDSSWILILGTRGSERVKPWYENAYSPCCSSYTSYETNKENLSKYQDISSLVITFLIITWTFEQVVIM